MFSEATPILNPAYVDIYAKIVVILVAGNIYYAMSCLDKYRELTGYANNPDKSYYDKDLVEFIKLQRENILSDAKTTLMKGITAFTVSVGIIILLCYVTSAISNSLAAYVFAAICVTALALRSGMIVLSDLVGYSSLKRYVTDSVLAAKHLKKEQMNYLSRSVPVFIASAIVAIFLISHINIS